MISIPTSLNREPGKFVAEPLRDDVQILIQQQIHLVLRYHSLNVFEHNQKIRITVKVALRSWDSLRVYLLRGHCLVSIVSFFFLIVYYRIAIYLVVIRFMSRGAQPQTCRSSASWPGDCLLNGNIYSESQNFFVMSGQRTIELSTTGSR